MGDDQHVRTFVDMGQQERLAQPFPTAVVQQKNMGGGRSGSYVRHGIVKQRVIAALGHPPSTAVVEWLYGDYPETTTGVGTDKERTWPALHGVIVGVRLRMSATIDGARSTVEDVGTPEAGYQQTDDGERAKRAISDAWKRCAAQLGVGLEFWSGGVSVAHLALAAVAVAGARAAEALAEADEAMEAVDHDAPDADDVHQAAEQAANGQPGTSTPPEAPRAAQADSETPAPVVQPLASGDGWQVGPLVVTTQLVRWLQLAKIDRVVGAVRRGQQDEADVLAAAKVLDHRDAEHPSTGQRGGWYATLHEALATEENAHV